MNQDNNNNNNNTFMDLMNYLSLAISIANYKQNLQQSTTDDIIQTLNHHTNAIVARLQNDLQEQNKMLKQILERLERLEKKQ